MYRQQKNIKSGILLPNRLNNKFNYLNIDASSICKSSTYIPKSVYKARNAYIKNAFLATKPSLIQKDDYSTSIPTNWLRRYAPLSNFFITAFEAFIKSMLIKNAFINIFATNNIKNKSIESSTNKQENKINAINKKNKLYENNKNALDSIFMYPTSRDKYFINKSFYTKLKLADSLQIYKNSFLNIFIESRVFKKLNLSYKSINKASLHKLENSQIATNQVIKINSAKKINQIAEIKEARKIDNNPISFKSFRNIFFLCFFCSSAYAYNYDDYYKGRFILGTSLSYVNEQVGVFKAQRVVRPIFFYPYFTSFNLSVNRFQADGINQTINIGYEKLFSNFMGFRISASSGYSYLFYSQKKESLAYNAALEGNFLFEIPYTAYYGLFGVGFDMNFYDKQTSFNARSNALVLMPKINYGYYFNFAFGFKFLKRNKIEFSMNTMMNFKSPRIIDSNDLVGSRSSRVRLNYWFMF